MKFCITKGYNNHNIHNNATNDNNGNNDNNDNNDSNDNIDNQFSLQRCQYPYKSFGFSSALALA